MTIKVISLNLWWGGILLPAALQFLKAQAADIVALQEVHAGHGSGLKERQRSMEALRRELGYPHDDFAEAFMALTPEGKIPFGNAVLSRFPITRRSKEFLVEPKREVYQDVPEQWPIQPRVLQGVAVSTPAGPLCVYNLHGVRDEDGDNPTPPRRRMLARVLAATSDKDRVIVAGDSNASRGNPIFAELSRSLRPVFGSELTTTFNMRRKDKPGFAAAAVDIMYVSPSITVVDKACPDVDISDHRPLVAELEIA